MVRKKKENPFAHFKNKRMKKHELVITVPFDTGIEMEENLNKAIESLSEVIQKVWIRDRQVGSVPEFNLEGQNLGEDTPIYRVTVKPIITVHDVMNHEQDKVN